MTLLGIFENIIADILFILLAIGLGWIWLVLTRRRKLQQFFGASSSKRLVIYLSNLRVLPFGSVGISGQRMSYQGSTMANGELQGANKIRDLHSFPVPSLAETQGALKRWLYADVLVQILLSPVDEDKLETEAPFITFGSAAYNVASGYVENTAPGSARFRSGMISVDEVETMQGTVPPVASSTDEGVYVIPPSGTATAWYPPGSEKVHTARDDEEDIPSAILIDDIPEITDPTYGFVERLNDPDTDRMLFYVAGLSELSTTGAAHFLASEWRYLERKYSENQAFLVMLRFQEPDYTKWSIIFERELPSD